MYKPRSHVDGTRYTVGSRACNLMGEVFEHDPKYKGVQYYYFMCQLWTLVIILYSFHTSFATSYLSSLNIVGIIILYCLYYYVFFFLLVYLYVFFIVLL